MSERKFADANDLGIDDPKQVGLRASPVSMFWTKKRCFNAECIRGGIGWTILSTLM